MKPLHTDTLEFTPIFIGGSPRSGTTLLNSLVCSSEWVNQHIQESSYFSWSIDPLKKSLDTFVNSQGHYFDNEEELMAFHKNILEQILISIWIHTNRPKMLCLKNPNMAKDFFLLSKLFDKAKYIVIIRSPCDIISSRYDAEKRGNSSFSLNDDFINSEIYNINSIHEALLSYCSFGNTNNLLIIEYEKLAQGHYLQELNTFLQVPDISFDKVWSRTKEKMHSKDSQWITNLYGKPIQDTSIGRYTKNLNSKMVNHIENQTNSVYQQLKNVINSHLM